MYIIIGVLQYIPLENKILSFLSLQNVRHTEIHRPDSFRPLVSTERRDNKTVTLVSLFSK